MGFFAFYYRGQLVTYSFFKHIHDCFRYFSVVVLSSKISTPAFPDSSTLHLPHFVHIFMMRTVSSILSWPSCQSNFFPPFYPLIFRTHS